MEDIHKKTTNGVGHNSNILKDKSPTVEAVEDQLFKVGVYINDITSNFFRILDQVRGSHGDEVVVNKYEREEGKPDWHRVVRKPTKYERGVLHHEACKSIEEVHDRLTNLHLNIDTYINGDVKEVTDKPRIIKEISKGPGPDDVPGWMV